jgi:hypothetical protein
VQLARLAAGNFDHWLASFCFAFCSSFIQLFIDWSTERPAVAATSSLQLRAMSNFGTPSATATINCEFKIIIEIEMGIWSLPITAAADSFLQRAPKRRFHFKFLFKTGRFRLCKIRQESRCFLVLRER